MIAQSQFWTNCGKTQSPLNRYNIPVQEQIFLFAQTAAQLARGSA